MPYKCSLEHPCTSSLEALVFLPSLEDEHEKLAASVCHSERVWGWKRGKRDDVLFQAPLQDRGHETQEACGAVKWFKPKETEEDKSSKKRQMHGSPLWKLQYRWSCFVFMFQLCPFNVNFFSSALKFMAMNAKHWLCICLPFKSSLGGWGNSSVYICSQISLLARILSP